MTRLKFAALSNLETPDPVRLSLSSLCIVYQSMLLLDNVEEDQGQLQEL
jgi:hypothetical protein